MNMRSVVFSMMFVLVPATAFAQANSFNSGIKLRGAFHVNRSDVDTKSPDFKQPEAGYGVGFEFTGNRFGLGMYGYTPGRTDEFESATTQATVVLEANSYFPVERIRLAPYVGAHTGLGVFTKDFFSDPFFPKPLDGLKHLGYQVGVRFKPIPLIGLDVQYRRQSQSAADLTPDLERGQVLVGFTLF
jgi:hypothetical protein